MPKQRPGLLPAVSLYYLFDAKPMAWQRAVQMETAQGKEYHFNPSDGYERKLNRFANEQIPLAEPFTGPLAVVVNLRFQHGKHGDIDNTIKSIFDGLSPKTDKTTGQWTRPGIWRSDKIIKKVTVEIFYEPDLEPCSEIIVYAHKPRRWTERVRIAALHWWTKISNSAGRGKCKACGCDPQKAFE
jgi:Holliday junction resolvase RusA-like endonuclease